VSSPRAKGAEIVLDTKVAELSALEKFDGYAQHAPWSGLGEGKPLRPSHFDPKASQDLFGQIARFAIERSDGRGRPASAAGKRFEVLS